MNIMDRSFQKLHLGCFDQAYDGWVNADVTPHIFISRVPGLALILFTLISLPVLLGERLNGCKVLILNGSTALPLSQRRLGSGTQQPILCLCGWCLKSISTRN
jgi:hypothetical protein